MRATTSVATAAANVTRCKFVCRVGASERERHGDARAKRKRAGTQRSGAERERCDSTLRSHVSCVAAMTQSASAASEMRHS